MEFKRSAGFKAIHEQLLASGFTYNSLSLLSLACISASEGILFIL